jgi:hypothetical protein
MRRHGRSRRGNVNYDANDRFCLDGPQLIMVMGSTYGPITQSTAPKIHSFVKIKAYGSAGNGPSYFKLWTKAGEVMELGNSADSKVEAQGKASVRVWALSKLQDVSGNYLTVSYTEDNGNGDYRPALIDCTGNASGGLAPSRSVQFYTTPVLTFIRSISAAQIASMGLLTNIKTYVGTTLVRDYRLAYQNGSSTGRSRLISVTACAGSGSAALCLSPLLLGYSEYNLNLSLQLDPIGSSNINGSPTACWWAITTGLSDV